MQSPRPVIPSFLIGACRCTGMSGRIVGANRCLVAVCGTFHDPTMTSPKISLRPALFLLAHSEARYHFVLQ